MKTNSVDPGEMPHRMWHLIWVYTVCKHPIKPSGLAPHIQALRSTVAKWLSIRLEIEGSLGQDSPGRHCLVSLSKKLHPLLSTGTIQENRKLSPHD